MIKQLIGEDGAANIIEFYLLQKSPINDETKINIYINDDLISKIKSSFKKTKEYKSVYYSRNNCNYVYDLSNDSQFVYIRKLENMSIINKSNSLSVILYNLPAMISSRFNKIFSWYFFDFYLVLNFVYVVK
jgi:hypothetical protein